MTDEQRKIEALANKIQQREEEIKYTEINALREQLAEKDNKIELLNPCNHTGFESISCQICGYPDSRKLIAALKAELKQQYEESIAIIHDLGAEDISLREALKKIVALAEAKEMKSPLVSSCPAYLRTEDGFEPIHPMLREGLRIAATIAREALK